MVLGAVIEAIHWPQAPCFVKVSVGDGTDQNSADQLNGGLNDENESQLPQTEKSCGSFPPAHGATSRK